MLPPINSAQFQNTNYDPQNDKEVKLTHQNLHQSIDAANYNASSLDHIFNDFLKSKIKIIKESGVELTQPQKEVLSKIEDLLKGTGLANHTTYLIDQCFNKFKNIVKVIRESGAELNQQQKEALSKIEDLLKGI